MGLAPSERASKIIRVRLRKLSFDELGALPLAEGGGAKHSPLTGAHGKMWQKSSKINFSSWIILEHLETLQSIYNDS